jgi:hypothetical protein
MALNMSWVTWRDMAPRRSTELWELLSDWITAR